MRWRRSTGGGSIYRKNRVGANLIYLFAASVKSEGVQVDTVTVRTVIKGLRRWFDSKRSWFWRYFSVQDLLVGPSAVPSNGNIAYGHIKWRDSVQEVGEFEKFAGESGQGCSDLTVDYQIGRVNCGRHHYCREFRSINDFILQNWGACVGTVFGHVSFDTHLELMRCRSVDGAVVTSLQGGCRWRWLPMGRQPNMTKSRSDGIFMPMTSASICR